MIRTPALQKAKRTRAQLMRHLMRGRASWMGCLFYQKDLILLPSVPFYPRLAPFNQLENQSITIATTGKGFCRVNLLVWLIPPVPSPEPWTSLIGEALCHGIYHIIAYSLEKTWRKALKSPSLKSYKLSGATTMANLFRWFWDYLLWLFWYAHWVAKYYILSPSWSLSIEEVLTNLLAWFKGYRNGGHDHWFAKCREDFATSRSCSKWHNIVLKRRVDLSAK